MNEKQIIRTTNVMFYPRYGHTEAVTWYFQYSSPVPNKALIGKNRETVIDSMTGLLGYTPRVTGINQYDDMYKRLFAKANVDNSTNSTSLLNHDYTLIPDMEYMRIYNQLKSELETLELMTSEKIGTLPLFNNVVYKDDPYIDMYKQLYSGNLQWSDPEPPAEEALSELLGPAFSTFLKIRRLTSMGISALMGAIGDGPNFSKKYENSFIDFEKNQIKVKHSGSYQYLASTITIRT